MVTWVRGVSTWRESPTPTYSVCVCVCVCGVCVVCVCHGHMGARGVHVARPKVECVRCIELRVGLD